MIIRTLYQHLLLHLIAQQICILALYIYMYIGNVLENWFIVTGSLVIREGPELAT